MKGLENMTALILDEAEKDAKTILADAQNEAETILAEYRKKAEEERTAETTAAMAEATLLTRRAEASAEQIRRNRLLLAKNDLLDTAFSSALQKLLDLPVAELLEIYTAIFASVLDGQLRAEQSACENDLYDEYTAPTTYKLMLTAKDNEALGADLLKAANALANPHGKTVVLANRTASINGGFILVCGDVELNCALGGYMEQIRSTIEGEVCQILFA